MISSVIDEAGLRQIVSSDQPIKTAKELEAFSYLRVFGLHDPPTDEMDMASPEQPTTRRFLVTA